MIRKSYPLKDWTTFNDVSKVVKAVEKRYPHLYCRIDIHRLEFEVICKSDEINHTQEIVVHNICRPIWDKRITASKEA